MNNLAPAVNGPDFFCIGAQKAGTTWLHQNLNSQNWFNPCLMKEIHFFDTLFLWPNSGTPDLSIIYRRACEAINYHVREIRNGTDGSEINLNWLEAITGLASRPFDLDWYRSCFSACGPDEVCGDFTPDYCLLDSNSIGIIHSTFPDAKYILMLREPISRGWSEMRMILGSRATEEELLTYIDDPIFIARADYANIINRWRAVVGDKNLLIVFYDEIVSHPIILLNRISHFLGREGQGWPQATTAIHKGTPDLLPCAVESKLARILRPNVEALRFEFEEIAAKWITNYQS